MLLQSGALSFSSKVCHVWVLPLFALRPRGIICKSDSMGTLGRQWTEGVDEADLTMNSHLHSVGTLNASGSYIRTLGYRD